MDISINKDERIDDLDLKGLKIIQKEKAFRFGIDVRYYRILPMLNQSIG